jgi:hypothetical protein
MRVFWTKNKALREEQVCVFQMVKNECRRFAERGDGFFQTIKNQVVMPCNCVSDIRQKMIGMKVQRGIIAETQYENISLYVPVGTHELSIRTYSELIIQIEGKKGNFKHPIVHRFCPFCGIEYGQIENKSSAPDEA